MGETPSEVAGMDSSGVPGRSEGGTVLATLVLWVVSRLVGVSHLMGVSEDDTSIALRN
jgi:hypothetical protein